MTVISDTSVLCYLALIGKLELLKSFFGHVILPQKVLDECLHPEAPLELRRVFSGQFPSFIAVEEPQAILPETVSLDPGESAAISLAWQYRSESLLLIDERSGRAIAQALGLKVRGLAALVAEAHRKGQLDFDSAMEELQRHGFRLSSSLLHRFRNELHLN